MADLAWPWVTIADAADVRLSSVDKKITPGEKRVRLCNYTDVYHQRVLRADLDYMEGTATEREIRNCQLNVGDVVITKDSETPDDIGVPALVGEAVTDLICGYHLAILRPKKDTLNGEFLHYALGTNNAKRQFQRYANGITRFGLRIDDIHRVAIPLPHLSEQRRVATILASVDDAIEKTQAVIDQVQIVKHGVMRDLFSSGSAPGTSAPRKWSTECIGNLFSLQLGKMLNKKARETMPRFPYLGNKDVQWGRFDFSNLREMHFNDAEREKFRLVPGDLMVCEGGEIGRTALWAGEFECHYQKAIHRLRPQDPNRIDSRFVLHFMRFAATYGLFSDLVSQSSIAHLTREKLALLEVPLPSLREQRKIADVLSAIDGYTKQTEATVRQMETTKQSLMSVLMTGDLRLTGEPKAA